MTSKFPRNMCLADRILRIVAGVALIYIGFVAQHLVDNAIINVLLGILGVMNVAAAVTAHCPIYTLASISTWKKKTEES